MPTDTFHNLKPDKRQRFLEVAYLEFAKHEYATASVSRIVAELGIAKGSVYQYFEDKRDLYFYLLDRASSLKFEFIREFLSRRDDQSDAVETDGAGAKEKDEFFGRHEAIIMAGTTFDFRFPCYSLLMVNAMREAVHPDLGNLAGDLTSRSLQFLREYVDLGIERGEIRQDIDPGLAARAVNTLTLALGPHMEAKYGFPLTEQLEHPERPLPFSDEELRREVSALVEIMRGGLRPKNDV